jgi:hypothetical protein
MKNFIFLITLFFYTSSSLANKTSSFAKTFECKTQFHIFSQDYQQGDDLYVDIYLSENGKIKVKIAESFGPDYELFQTEGNDYSMEINDTFLVSKNESSFISMAFLGDNNWAAHINIHTLDRAEFVPNELEIHCKQTAPF